MRKYWMIYRILLLVSISEAYVLPYRSLFSEEKLDTANDVDNSIDLGFSHYKPKFTPHHTDCEYYYEEDRHGDMKLKHCHRNKKFDVVSLECVDENVARCYNDEEEYVRNGEDELKESKSDNFKCPYKYGSYPNPKDCTTYYLCHNGKHHLKKCHCSERFDWYKKACIWKELVVCINEDESKETSIGTSTEEPKHPFSCPYAYGKFPHPKDCSKFYTCTGYRHNLRQCQKYELFDEKRKECKKGKRVDCGSRDNPYEKKTTTVETITTTETSKPERTTYPEISTVQISTSTDFTEKPEDTTVTDDGNDDREGNKNKKFKCPSKYGAYPNPKDCTTYYLCLNGKHQLKKCHYNKLFDRRKGECRRKELVDCIDEDESKETSTEEPETPFRCPQKNGKFAHPKDCSMFYTCTNYKYNIRQCQKHKLFDEKKKQCKKDKKVDCESRPNPYEKKTSTEVPTTTTKISTQFPITHSSTVKPFSTSLSSKSSEKPLTSSDFVTDYGKTTSFKEESENPEISTTDNSFTDYVVSTQRPKSTVITDSTETTEDSKKESEKPEVSITFNDFTESSINTQKPESTAITDKKETTLFEKESEKPEVSATISPFTEPIISSKRPVETSTSVRPTDSPSEGGTTRSDEISTAEITTSTKFNPKTFRCPKRQGVFIHPDDCSAYIFCDSGAWQILYCPPGTFFDTEKMVCFDENEVDCGDRLEGRGLSTNIAASTPSVVDEPTNASEKPELFTTGTVIMTETEAITSSQTATTSQPFSTSQEIIPSTEGPESTEQSTLEPSEEQTQTDIPSTTEQSEATSTLEEISSTELDTTLGERTQQTEASTTYELITTAEPFVCPKKKGNFADAKDCSKYYACRKGKALHEKCPKLMLFHTKYGTCFADDQVDCGDRPLPTEGDTTDDSREVQTPGTPDEELKEETTEDIFSEKISTEAPVTSSFTSEKPFSKFSTEKEIVSERTTETEIVSEVTTKEEIAPESTTEKEIVSEVVTEIETKPEITTQDKTVTEVTVERETVTKITSEISEISSEKETISDVATGKETVPEITTEQETVPEITTEQETVPEITTEQETVPEITTKPETVPEVTTERKTVSETTTEQEIVSEITTQRETVSEITAERETTPEIITARKTVPDITTESELVPEITTMKRIFPESTTKLKTFSEVVFTEKTVPQMSTSEAILPGSTDTIATTPKSIIIDEENICYPYDETCVKDPETGFVLRCPEASGLFAHPRSLTLFIHCDDFRIFIQTCPKGLVFNPFFKVCVWPPHF